MSASEPVMDAVEKVARALFDGDYPFSSLPVGRFPQSVIHRERYMRQARHLLAAFPQLALEGREEWEYAQAIPEYNHRDEVVGWNAGKTFHSDPNRALDEGYTLVRRAIGPWSEVLS